MSNKWNDTVSCIDFAEALRQMKRTVEADRATLFTTLPVETQNEIITRGVPIIQAMGNRYFLLDDRAVVGYIAEDIMWDHPQWPQEHMIQAIWSAIVKAAK